MVWKHDVIMDYRWNVMCVVWYAGCVCGNWNCEIHTFLFAFGICVSVATRLKGTDELDGFTCRSWHFLVGHGHVFSGCWSVQGHQHSPGSPYRSP